VRIRSSVAAAYAVAPSSAKSCWSENSSLAALIIMKSNANNHCPACRKPLSHFEISATFDCPHCNAALSAKGFGAVGTLEFVAGIVFGGLLVVAIIAESFAFAAFVFAGWLLTEFWLRSQMLEISRRSPAEPSS
jgi:ribosomal protein L37AE/L43A